MERWLASRSEEGDALAGLAVANPSWRADVQTLALDLAHARAARTSGARLPSAVAVAAAVAAAVAGALAGAARPPPPPSFLPSSPCADGTLRARVSYRSFRVLLTGEMKSCVA